MQSFPDLIRIRVITSHPWASRLWDRKPSSRHLAAIPPIFCE
jgi:hypothetical protein